MGQLKKEEENYMQIQIFVNFERQKMDGRSDLIEGELLFEV
jgi:hypothetical protein